MQWLKLIKTLAFHYFHLTFRTWKSIKAIKGRSSAIKGWSSSFLALPFNVLCFYLKLAFESQRQVPFKIINSFDGSQLSHIQTMWPSLLILLERILSILYWSHNAEICHYLKGAENIKTFLSGWLLKISPRNVEPDLINVKIMTTFRFLFPTDNWSLLMFHSILSFS